MPNFLNNKPKSADIKTDLRRSYGPFLAVDNGGFLFDTLDHDVPLHLGYNASPLFGMLQFRECWTGNESEQTGLVRQAFQALLKRTGIAETTVDAINNFRPGPLLYYYICYSILEQYSDEYQAAGDTLTVELNELAGHYSDAIQSCEIEASRLKFILDFKSTELADRFVARAFSNGIHCEAVANTGRIRFRLNLSYRPGPMALFWKQMKRSLEALHSDMPSEETVRIGDIPDVDSTFRFHEQLLSAKASTQPPVLAAVEYLSSRLGVFGKDLKPVVLTRANFQSFRPAILQMQQDVYEPARRSPAEEFDMLFNSGKPLAIAVVDTSAEPAPIVAMSFAGQLGLFIQERGVTEDPFVDDPDTFYSMDLTIDQRYRGGLGRVMKQAMVLLALENGVGAIHGRNRDRLARGMWAINLSLGSFELQHLEDDYPDQGPFRDCIYYRNPLRWSDGLTEEQLKDVIAAMPQTVNGRMPDQVAVNPDADNVRR